MIRKNQKYFNKLHILMDAIIIILAYVSAWAIKAVYDSANHKVGGVSASPMYLYALLAVVPVYLILYGIFKLYAPKRMHGQKYEIMNILKANVVGIMIFFFVLYLTKLTDFSRAVLFIFFGLNIVYEFIARVLIRMLLRSIRKRGFNQKHILLVGYSRAAEAYIDRIKQYPQWGYNVLGILDDNVELDKKYRGERVLGRIADIEDFIANNDLDEIVITLGIGEYERLEEIVMICEKSGVHTKFIPDYNHIIPTRPYIEDVLGLPVVNIRHVPLSNIGNRFLKRCMDIFVGTLALILFSPIMLVAIIGIKVSSKGPIIYMQKRIGLHNKEFEMYKFRSMMVQTDGGDAKKWTTSDDPRVTKFGKFMRKTSIDELPQIINVLKGDMSLVGPRPERPFYVDKFKEEIPRYMVKHQIRPGMTGWAQVNGYRGDTSIEKRIECDLYYIENWSLFFDIKIMFRTIFEGFINKNAY